MANVDMLFIGILRVSLIALVILTTAVVALRYLKQPLERVRLIQISMLALFVTGIFGAAGILPTIELAVLPAPGSSLSAVDTEQVDRGNRPTADDSGAARPSPSPVEIAETEAGAELPPIWSPSAANAAPDTTSIAESSTSSFAFLPWLKEAFVYGFLFVSLLNVVYLVIGFLATKRLISCATPLPKAAADRVARIVTEFSQQRRVRFVSSSKIDVPMVSGIWRPTVLLPEALTRMDADPLELKHSLAHEWGHIERRDLLTWQVASLWQALLWIQPCYWIMRRELRLAQDQIADQFATKQPDEFGTYAVTLMQLSRARQRMLPGALTMAAGKSNLYRRIEMLTNDKFRIVRVTRKPVMLSLGMLIAVAGGLLTSLQFTHASNPTMPLPAIKPSGEGDDEKGTTKEPVKENAATTAQAPKSAEHSGILTDADTGKPIAGATVTVTRMNSGDWRELAVTESMTDENGKYTFTIPPEQLSQRLLYIMFDVDHPTYAGRHCGSYGYGMIVKNLAAGEQPWFSELKMVQGEKIFGRLVDENQQPVAGAQLRASSRPKTGFDRVRSTSVDGISDKDGRFELVVARDGIAKLSIIPTDHCMKHIELVGRRGDIGDIPLTRGLSIQGVVQDAKGNPMSDLWVNLTPEDQRREASYEMKRSSKTDSQGKFQTRPIQPGKYLVQVELKATGALEKLKYANFHNTPPPAMFVEQTINVTEHSARKPFVIQAVPHVLITLQHYKPDGEISGGHSPNMLGEYDGRRIWIQKGKKTGKGAYQLMAPHGMEDVELRFSTNEHSGLMVQFEGGKLSPQDSYRFEKLESDINNIRVIRHVAAILKVRIVDQSGTDLKDAGIFATYAIEKDAGEEAMMSNQIGFNREDGLFRLSSLVPNVDFQVRASLAGFQSETQKISMKEGERRTITMTLKPKAATEEKKEAE